MHELSRQECEIEAQRLRIKICKKYNFSMNEILKIQKESKENIEGFVVKFSNGLRVKFKTEEYVRMNKILNSMNIKTVWESMADGKIPVNYLMCVPEEIREEAERHKVQLEKEYQKILEDSKQEWSLLPVLPRNVDDKEAYKTIGLFMKDNSSKFKYPMLVFPWVRGQYDELGKIIKKLIEPKLGE